MKPDVPTRTAPANASESMGSVHTDFAPGAGKRGRSASAFGSFVACAEGALAAGGTAWPRAGGGFFVPHARNRRIAGKARERPSVTEPPGPRLAKTAWNSENRMRSRALRNGARDGHGIVGRIRIRRRERRSRRHRGARSFEGILDGFDDAGGVLDVEGIGHVIEVVAFGEDARFDPSANTICVATRRVVAVEDVHVPVARAWHALLHVVGPPHVVPGDAELAAIARASVP